MRKLLVLLLLFVATADAQVSNSTVTVKQPNASLLNATVNVTGTVPLPSGAATSANQLTEIGHLSSIDTKLTSQATAANQATGNASLASLDAKTTVVNTGAVTISTALPAGNNNIGDVDIASSALPTGAATETTLSTLNGKVTNGSGTSTAAVRVELPTNGTGVVGLNAGTNNIGDVDVLTLPNVTIGNGQVASAAAVSGNPVHIGSVASTSEPAVGTNGAVYNPLLDSLRKFIVYPYAMNGRQVTGRTGAFNSAASQQIIAAGAAGTRNYLTQCVFGNTDSAVHVITLQNGGSAVEDFVVGPADSVPVPFPHPLRGGDATAWNCATTAFSSAYCSCSGFASLN